MSKIYEEEMKISEYCCEHCSKEKEKEELEYATIYDGYDQIVDYGHFCKECIQSFIDDNNHIG